MKIKLAFFKDRDNLLDDIIKLWTKSKYSHIEIIIKDKWISSSPIDGGVHILELHELDHNKYNYIEVDVDGRKFKKVQKYIESQKDAKYDKWGIFFGVLFNSGLEDKNKLFCSEMITKILQIFEVEEVSGLAPHKITPGDLAKIFGLE